MPKSLVMIYHNLMLANHDLALRLNEYFLNTGSEYFIAKISDQLLGTSLVRRFYRHTSFLNTFQV